MELPCTFTEYSRQLPSSSTDKRANNLAAPMKYYNPARSERHHYSFSFVPNICFRSSLLYGRSYALVFFPSGERYPKAM